MSGGGAPNEVFGIVQDDVSVGPSETKGVDGSPFVRYIGPRYRLLWDMKPQSGKIDWKRMSVGVPLFDALVSG